MSRQIQFRRGTADQHKVFTGAPGEITVDLTNKTLRVHDGETPGGTTLARMSDVSAVTPQLDFDARTDYTSASQITIPSNGILFCRGNTRAMDWVESDFNTVIMAEYVLIPGIYGLSNRKNGFVHHFNLLLCIFEFVFLFKQSLLRTNSSNKPGKPDKNKTACQNYIELKPVFLIHFCFFFNRVICTFDYASIQSVEN